MKKLIINTTKRTIKTGILNRLYVAKAVVGVDLETNTITIGSDVTGHICAGMILTLIESTGNDGKYTVRTIVELDGDTFITFIQPLADATIDGSILHQDAIDTINKTITFDSSVGNVSAEFSAGDYIGLIGLAVAGGVYTVASAAHATRTTVTVNQTISSPQAFILEPTSSSLTWIVTGGAAGVLIMNQPSNNGVNLETTGWTITVRNGSMPHHQNEQIVVITKGNYEFSALPTDIVLNGTLQTGTPSAVATAIDTAIN